MAGEGSLRTTELWPCNTQPWCQIDLVLRTVHLSCSHWSLIWVFLYLLGPSQPYTQKWLGPYVYVLRVFHPKKNPVSSHIKFKMIQVICVFPGQFPLWAIHSSQGPYGGFTKFSTLNLTSAPESSSDPSLGGAEQTVFWKRLTSVDLFINFLCLKKLERVPSIPPPSLWVNAASCKFSHLFPSFTLHYLRSESNAISWRDAESIKAHKKKAAFPRTLWQPQSSGLSGFSKELTCSSRRWLKTQPERFYSIKLMKKIVFWTRLHILFWLLSTKK